MANSLLVKLGFSADKRSIVGTVDGVNDVTKAVVGLHSKIKQTFALAGVQAFASGIKSLGMSIKDSFVKSYNVAEEYARTGDRIAKTSRLVGLSVKDYQAFSSAAKHAGISTEEMDSALKRMNISLGKARSGDKTSIKMFDAILGGKKLSDYKDTTSLIEGIADGYSKLASAEQKAFVSQELFGKSGLKMSELLSGGKEGIKKLISDFEDNGGGFSDEGARKAEEFNDELQKMKETVDSLKISVAQELFPVFINFFKTVQNFVKGNRQELIPVVKELFGTTADFIKKILPQIPKLLNLTLSIIELIGPKWILIGAGIIALLPKIGMIVFGLFQMLPILKGIAAVIGGPVLGYIALIVAAVVSWGFAVKSVYDNWDMLKSFIVDDVWGAIKDFGKKIVSFGEKIWGGFKSVLIDPFIVFFGSLPDYISGLWNDVKNVFKELGSMIYDSIFGSISKALDAAKSFLKGIPGIGKLFGDDSISVSSGNNSGMTTLGASAAQAVQESRTTVTNRFAVDFKNMPRGVVVTPPEHGDFDYSRGYVLGGI